MFFFLLGVVAREILPCQMLNSLCLSLGVDLCPLVLIDLYSLMTGRRHFQTNPRSFAKNDV